MEGLDGREQVQQGSTVALVVAAETLEVLDDLAVDQDAGGQLAPRREGVEQGDGGRAAEQQGGEGAGVGEVPPHASRSIGGVDRRRGGAQRRGSTAQATAGSGEPRAWRVPRRLPVWPCASTMRLSRWQ
jgi:hypothetical protein